VVLAVERGCEYFVASLEFTRAARATAGIITYLLFSMVNLVSCFQVVTERTRRLPPQVQEMDSVLAVKRNWPRDPTCTEFWEKANQRLSHSLRLQIKWYLRLL
jgi:hypothetical protein